MPRPSAQATRFLIQIVFALGALHAVVTVPSPYGPTLAFFLLVMGLWLGRRVFIRMTAAAQARADPGERDDSNS